MFGTRWFGTYEFRVCFAISLVMTSEFVLAFRNLVTMSSCFLLVLLVLSCLGYFAVVLKVFTFSLERQDPSTKS